jgi:hypothetical protein
MVMALGKMAFVKTVFVCYVLVKYRKGFVWYVLVKYRKGFVWYMLVKYNACALRH